MPVENKHLTFVFSCQSMSNCFIQLLSCLTQSLKSNGGALGMVWRGETSLESWPPNLKGRPEPWPLQSEQKQRNKGFYVMTKRQRGTSLALYVAEVWFLSFLFSRHQKVCWFSSSAQFLLAVCKSFIASKGHVVLVSKFMFSFKLTDYY